MPEQEKWLGLATITMIETERGLNGKTSAATHYHISSRSCMGPEEALDYIRAHWGIENGLHWVLDVAFREDDSRVRIENAVENFAVLRHTALNLLRGVKGSKVTSSTQGFHSRQPAQLSLCSRKKTIMLDATHGSYEFDLGYYKRPFRACCARKVMDQNWAQTPKSRTDERSSQEGTSGSPLLHSPQPSPKAVLHDEVPTREGFAISENEISRRFVVELATEGLELVDLSGAGLKRLGGDASISSLVPYELPQAWAMALYLHPRRVDGIRYVSRHLNDRYALVLFERAESKLGSAAYFPLLDAPQLPTIIEELRVVFSSI